MPAHREVQELDAPVGDLALDGDDARGRGVLRRLVLVVEELGREGGLGAVDGGHGGGRELPRGRGGSGAPVRRSRELFASLSPPGAGGKQALPATDEDELRRGDQFPGRRSSLLDALFDGSYVVSGLSEQKEPVLIHKHHTDLQIGQLPILRGGGWRRRASTAGAKSVATPQREFLLMTAARPEASARNLGTGSARAHRWDL